MTYRFRTWHAEVAFVACALAVAVILSGGGAVEIVGACAVLLGFMHAEITDRMVEREARRPVAEIECYPWARRYFVAKEVLWLAYFVAHRSWSALVGVGVFLLYPVWRAWYRRRRPLEGAST